jgi:glycosidase
MHVVIDYVPNHTSDQHPWFIESRSSRDNPKRDWYVWKDAKPDGSLPNNWLSVFGGPIWEWDETTGQYYLHSFLKEQPDLNWRNPQVKQAMFDAIRFWLERGVDGFRLDVAHYIMKDPLMRDNPINPQPEIVQFKPMGDYDSLLHLYDKGHTDVHAVMREFRAILDQYSQTRPRYSVGEIHIFDWNEWASYYGSDLNELHMPFNFALVKTPFKAGEVRNVVDSLEAAIPDGAWPNYVLGNHDEPRLATRLGKKEARLAAMLLLTLRGTPTLYYGDELGMENVPVPPEKEQDPWGIRVPGLGRDPCRTPMQWDDTSNADFSTAEAQNLWLPVSEDYSTVNVKTELADPESFLNLYRKLLAVRHDTPALNHGKYTPVDCESPDCFMFIREEDVQKRLVILNFSSEKNQVSLPLKNGGKVVVSTGLDREGEKISQNVALRGWEGLLISAD